MPSNVTTVSGASPFDFWLGNYSYADFAASGETLRMKLCTSTHRLIWKNAAGTVVKAMADASTTSNHAQKRVLFTDANGAANTNSKLLYDNDTDVLGLGLETLHSWKSTHSAFDIGSQGALSYGAAELGLEENAYYDDTDDRWEYIGTGYATRIVQTAGTIALTYAASGTADNPITWVTGLHMTTAGKVLIGNDTSPASLLHLYDADTGVSPIAGTLLTLEQDADTWISLLVDGAGTKKAGLYVIDDINYGGKVFFDAQTFAWKCTLAPTAEKEVWRASSGDGGSTVQFVLNEGGLPMDVRMESDNLTHAFFLDGSEDKFAFGHGTPDVFVHIEQDTATTDAVQYLLRLTETCGDTVGDGFGVGMQFELESSTQATNFVAGTLAVEWEDESSGDANIVVRLVNGWSIGEVARFASNGKQVWSRAAITWTADQRFAFGIDDGNFAKLFSANGHNGGAALVGYNKATDSEKTIYALAYAENEPDGGDGLFHFRGIKHDGAGGTEAFSAASKMFSIKNNTTQLLELLGDGALTLLGVGADDVSYAAAAAGKYRLLYCDEDGNVVVGDNDLANNNVT